MLNPLLLSAEDHALIEKHIAAAEQKSAAEIVVAVVPASDSYAAWRAAAAVAASVLLVTTIAQLTTAQTAIAHLYPALWLAAIAPLTFAFYVLCGWSPIVRALVPDHHELAAVQRKAAELFWESGIHRTSGRTGILILLSECEHRVQLLVDVAVETVLQKTELTTYAETLAKAIHEGRAAEGLSATIDGLAERLAPHLPPRDTANEIPDAIRGANR